MDWGTLGSVLLGAVLSIAVAQVNELVRHKREAREARAERERAQLDALEEAELRLFATLAESARIKSWGPDAADTVRTFLAQLHLNLVANRVADQTLRDQVETMMKAFQRVAWANSIAKFNEESGALRDATETVRETVDKLRSPLR